MKGRRIMRKVRKARRTKRIHKSICPAVLKCVRHRAELVFANNDKDPGTFLDLQVQDVGASPGWRYGAGAPYSPVLITPTASTVTWDPPTFSWPILSTSDDTRQNEQIELASSDNRHTMVIEWPPESINGTQGVNMLNDRLYCIEVVFKCTTQDQFESLIPNTDASAAYAMGAWAVRKCNVPPDPTTITCSFNNLYPQTAAVTSKVTPSVPEWLTHARRPPRYTEDNVLQYRRNYPRIVKYRVRKFRRPKDASALSPVVSTDTRPTLTQRFQHVRCGFRMNHKNIKVSYTAAESIIYPRKNGFVYRQFWYYRNLVDEVLASTSNAPTVTMDHGSVTFRYRNI